jgi:hypothetical protein
MDRHLMPLFIHTLRNGFTQEHIDPSTPSIGTLMTLHNCPHFLFQLTNVATNFSERMSKERGPSVIFN